MQAVLGQHPVGCMKAGGTESSFSSFADSSSPACPSKKFLQDPSYTCFSFHRLCFLQGQSHPQIQRSFPFADNSQTHNSYSSHPLSSKWLLISVLKHTSTANMQMQRSGPKPNDTSVLLSMATTKIQLHSRAVSEAQGVTDCLLLQTRGPSILSAPPGSHHSVKYSSHTFLNPSTSLLFPGCLLRPSHHRSSPRCSLLPLPICSPLLI